MKPINLNKRMMQKLFLIFVLILSACSPLASDSPQPAPVVVTSTTFLADMAQNVAGDRLQVESLTPRGVDPHSYQPTPKDVAKIADSTLLIINGLNYDQFINPILGSAGGQQTLVKASAGLISNEDANGEDGIDPHLWMDPNLVIGYVENIRDALILADPQGEETYRLNAQTYSQQLRALDAWIVEQVEVVPAGRRLLVTNHESLGYFAKRYGFTVIGTLIPGFSSDAAPAAGQLAELIDQIEATGAPAVFLDAADTSTLPRQIASDAGVKVVTNLYVESLSDGAPSETYIDMMKHNVSQIVEALK